MLLTSPAPFFLGLAVLAAAWLVPAATFAAHMAAHMAVVAIAAPLLAMGVRGGAADPVTFYPRLLAPLLASFLELAVVWLWHTPWLHGLARRHSVFFVLEQVSFLGAGLYLWLSALGGAAAVSAPRRGAGLAALLLTAMHMTLLGALLALSPRPWYGASHHAPAAFPALDDQQLGGAIMLAVGGVCYLAGGVWLARELLYSKAPAPASATE